MPLRKTSTCITGSNALHMLAHLTVPDGDSPDVNDAIPTFNVPSSVIVHVSNRAGATAVFFSTAITTIDKSALSRHGFQ